MDTEAFDMASATGQEHILMLSRYPIYNSLLSLKYHLHLFMHCLQHLEQLGMVSAYGNDRAHAFKMADLALTVQEGQ